MALINWNFGDEFEMIAKSHQHDIVANITVVFVQKGNLNSNKFFNWCTDKYEMDGKGEFSISFSL